MTSCFVARISNPGERIGKPFYEVDVPSPLGNEAVMTSRVVFVPVYRLCFMILPSMILLNQNFGKFMKAKALNSCDQLVLATLDETGK